MRLTVLIALVINKEQCYAFVASTRTQIYHPTLLFNDKDSAPPIPKFIEEKTQEEWEWDGEAIEGAHDEEFEPGSGKFDATDMFMPSLSLLSMASSVTSPAQSVISGITSNFDPLMNAGKLYLEKVEKEMSEDDVLEIGGDPFFLDDDEGNSDTKMDMEDTDFFGWDGTVDEDAHLDFD